jgi:hypothetical protein
MTPLPYILASSVVPDDTPSLPGVDPSLGQPRPRPMDGGKVPPLPPSQSTETHAGRPLPMSPSMPERMRRNRDTAEPSPRPTSATEPPLPKLDSAPLLLPRAYKKPLVDAQKQHTITATDPSLSLFFYLSETSEVLETLAVAFGKFLAAVGVTVHARWRSQAITAVLHPRRQAISKVRPRVR